MSITSAIRPRLAFSRSYWPRFGAVCRERLWRAPSLGSVPAMRTQKAAWTPFILLALACGGSAAPAEGPNSLATNGQDSAPAGDENGTEPKPAAAKSDEAPEAADKAASSAPVSDDDVTAI